MCFPPFQHTPTTRTVEYLTSSHTRLVGTHLSNCNVVQEAEPREGGGIGTLLQMKLFRKTAVYPNMPITKLKSKVVSQRECDHTSAKVVYRLWPMWEQGMTTEREKVCAPTHLGRW